MTTTSVKWASLWVSKARITCCSLILVFLWKRHPTFLGTSYDLCVFETLTQNLKTTLSTITKWTVNYWYDIKFSNENTT